MNPLVTLWSGLPVMVCTLPPSTLTSSAQVSGQSMMQVVAKVLGTISLPSWSAGMDPAYRLTATPNTSNRAPKSSGPAPTNARAGNSLSKYVL